MDKESRLTYKELPPCIRGQIMVYLILAAGLLIFGMATAIGSLSLNVFLGTLGILAFYLIYCATWCLPFFRNKVLIIEGTVKEIEDTSKVESGITRTLARELVRYTYTIDSDGNEISVIKTGRKVKKPGTKVILYVPDDALTTKTDGGMLINRVLYTDITR